MDKSDAARMIIGPESKQPDLLDATDDVVRELVRLRREREHLIEAGDQLRLEVEQLRDVAWKHGNRADVAEAENERLRTLLDPDDMEDIDRLLAENKRLRAELALAEHMLKNHIHLADNSPAQAAAPGPGSDPR